MFYEPNTALNSLASFHKSFELTVITATLTCVPLQLSPEESVDVLTAVHQHSVITRCLGESLAGARFILEVQSKPCKSDEMFSVSFVGMWHNMVLFCVPAVKINTKDMIHTEQCTRHFMDVFYMKLDL